MRAASWAQGRFLDGARHPQITWVSNPSTFRQVSDLLYINRKAASEAYDYRATGYTKTPYLSKKVLSLTGASIGFQQFAAGGLNFAVSKRSKMHRIEKAQYYIDLLDAAKQIPIVLQDMVDRRAWLVDGERLILHIILHRHAIKPFVVNGAVLFESASPNDPTSVREAMIANVDKLVSLDRDIQRPGIRDKFFKDLVNELYTILEGLMAETTDIADAGIAMNLDWKKHIQGWEYMDVVHQKLTPRMREAHLKSTSGKWPELARDQNAIVLFGTHLQKIINPHPSVRLCKLFKELPKHRDYLGIESEKLEDMYLESGAENDRTQITPTGLQLHRSQHLFERCPRVDQCKCKRIQQLVPRKAKGTVKPIPKTNKSGAIIIGQGETSWINELGPSWGTLRGIFRHETVDLPSKTSNPVESTRSSNLLDLHSTRPEKLKSVSGSKSSSDNQSFLSTTTSTKATTLTSDTSTARSSGVNLMSKTNYMMSSAKALAGSNDLPLCEPGPSPYASSTGTTLYSSNASPPSKSFPLPQLPSISNQPPQDSKLAQMPQYPQTSQQRQVSQHPQIPQYLQHTPGGSQTNIRPSPSRPLTSKTFPENGGLDLSGMSMPPLRRRPNFPLTHPINVPRPV
jgi:hypothetical protein